ncbi:MAG TPA: DUF4166 domain-containing protein [Pseudomonas sp.]|uniref:DUF4166 domain-containing protein n=1 Tax=Pseudomonas sp. TaxID=306 RepID=UPI002EDB46FD
MLQKALMIGMYQKVLGDDFRQLAPVLQMLHHGQGASVSGRLIVYWPGLCWKRLLLRMLRMPHESGAAVSYVWIFPCARGAERWKRSIGGVALTSFMQAGGQKMIIERTGLLRLHLQTWVDAQGSLQQRSDRIYLRGLGLRLPGLVISASEHALEVSDFIAG